MKKPDNVQQIDNEWWYFHPQSGSRHRCTERTCENCGDVFVSYPSDKKKWCSADCYRKDCIRCNLPFKPNGPRQVYCSEKCKRGTCVCGYCDKIFVPTKKSAGLFCSTECFYEDLVPTFTLRKMPSGYIDIKVPKDTPNTRGTKCEKRWMAQHRYVMQEHLGRPLQEGENVHHKNGDRTDNRLENLQLWSKAQPAGQSIEDKLKFALEILALYGTNPDEWR